MAFLKGFLTGLTFSTATITLTLHLHLANRHHQRLLLREQIDLINTIALPTTTANATSSTNLRTASAEDAAAIAAVMARRGYYPREQPGIMDLAKERWNRQLEGGVRRVQEVGLEGLVKEGVRVVRGLREGVQGTGREG
ncbi:uncharacterized protein BDCG_02019 [Blastomyces dermatitidis ER-3]|uniref:MICOS complex subunit MIC12 n=1 Tax=Ajellomyces dermatitidis (strain ER-3 / ATCC MYA-2586) TaxID=559297 RepID=A0ABP2ESX3_AJEDR|nr:uncharacterized protein BDCG_02019 [Blastomyces dermatitidis ER-3]EEQ86899.1 hypothetical protein BDCG_02019 [Blastomyces dermatitidis ER-3]